MRAKVVAVVVGILVVFALTVGAVTLRLRSRIRAQMLGQEGSTLHAVAHFEAAQDDGDPLDMVLGLVGLEGVIGLRFYSRAGETIAALPARLVEQPPAAALLQQARQVDAVSRFEPQVFLDTLFVDPFGELTVDPVPLLTILVNLEAGDGRETEGGYVEFLVDGAPMAAAFADLDRALLGQSLVALGAGGGLILAVLLLSLVRLERANRELARTNRELTLHLKTAAVGSISAHLFHRLKHVVGDLGQEGGADDLRGMVQEVLDLFQDEELGLDYALDGEEFLTLAAAPLLGLAEKQGVTVALDGDPGIQLASRRGNLLILAVQNVLRNAIEATPRGRAVTCTCSTADHEVRIVVRDEGRGIAEDQRRFLFEPGYSSKPDGNGIGLSISRQLCRLAGGELHMVETGSGGTRFQVTLPTERAAAPPRVS